ASANKSPVVCAGAYFFVGRVKCLNLNPRAESWIKVARRFRRVASCLALMIHQLTLR
ncbi:MAG: hypothetical protein JWR19_2681, partial [Pedosphaera sp.]|nr:hypothetical protein [Pedosphaera sp.]